MNAEGACIPETHAKVAKTRAYTDKTSVAEREPVGAGLVFSGAASCSDSGSGSGLTQKNLF